MNFLNPYFLFGFFAIIIPILLHLFNLQKVRKMEFSTLMFLKEIQKSKLRKIRIKQILLLILRIMIIVSLVLGFSNPVYKGYLSGSNPDIRKCGIFIFDNSFSMSVKDEYGSYYEQAKKSVINILQLYNPDDKIFLITASRLKSFEKGELKDIGSFIDSLKNLELTSVSFTLSDLVRYTKEIMENESFPLYEVFVLSDFQKINLASDNFDKDIFKETKKKLRFYNIITGSREANNISIEKVDIKSKILEINKDIKISVTLRNHNKFNALNKQVSLFLDDKKISETVTDIVSLERKELEFTLKSPRTGSIGGYAELLQNDIFEDELIQDNKYYFSINIPDKVNIGLISNGENYLKYIRLAMESAEKLNGISNEQRFYNVNESTDINNAISMTDMLIISGKNNFSEVEISIINDYLKNGGGVLLFPAKNIKTDSYNSLFSKINAFRIEDISRVTQDTNTRRRFEKIDFEHPIFSGAFRNEDLSMTSNKYFIGSPRIDYIYNIYPNSNTSKLMQLSGSRLLLVESDSGDGKLVFCAVSGDNEMSDLPMKSIFPLIVNKCILYLGKGEFKDMKNVVGKNNVISFGKNKLYEADYSDIYKEPGIYPALFPNDSRNYFFALNRDSLESILQKSEESEIKEFLKSYGIDNAETLPVQSDIKSSIVDAREGVELWRYLIVLALILVLCEMIYSKKLENI